MAVVPYSRAQNGSQVGQPMPSEENLLMAAAIMHQQGKFQPQGQQMAGDVIDATGDFTKRRIDAIDSILTKGKEYDTRRTLDRALGVKNVLPIKPEGK